MIFRTGSILIVGKCNEIILNYVYNFVKDILVREYPKIKLNNNNPDNYNNNPDNYNNELLKKIKKKYIYTMY